MLDRQETYQTRSSSDRPGLTGDGFFPQRRFGFAKQDGRGSVVKFTSILRAVTDRGRADAAAFGEQLIMEHTSGGAGVEMQTGVSPRCSKGLDGQTHGNGHPRDGLFMTKGTWGYRSGVRTPPHLTRPLPSVEGCRGQEPWWSHPGCQIQLDACRSIYPVVVLRLANPANDQARRRDRMSSDHP